MDRNPISDLEAVAAMPGLEELAAVMAAHIPPGSGSAVDAVSMLIFEAGRWAFGSANVCDSVLRCTSVWEGVRRSAQRVGRPLPEVPPTFDKLRHFRRAADEGLAEALADALPRVAVPLAQAIGLLDPDVPVSWHRPKPGNVIYGDGSVFAPLSDVHVDEDGVVQGSRASTAPRIAPRFEGKDGKDAGTGLPITVVGCHGRKRWQRVILGVDLFRDGNEIGSSLRLFDRIIDLAQGGVGHVVYDRLMSGTHMRRLMKLRVTPVVAMPEAPSNLAHVLLPAELQRAGYRSAGTREKRKGKGARRRSADDVAPKSRLSIHLLRVIGHPCGDRTCTHELWAIDGAVVSVPPGGEVTIEAPVLECTDVQWRLQADGWHPVGTLRVPCAHGTLRVEIDFAGDRKGKNKSGEPLSLADWVRPIPEAATYFARTEGLRSDVESVFSWLKAMLPRGRAGSLDPEHFFLDVIGAALVCNAIAWDVHVARHTACAQHEARLVTRRTLRASGTA